MAERWLTDQQAGGALGMTAEAVRQRARRLGWRTQPGNEGKALVLVPGGVEVRPRHGESATVRERMESGRQRADRDEAEREAARIAAAAAEGEAKGLRLALDEARRPFWRRWIG